MITGSFSLVGIQDAILVESCYKATQQNIAPSAPTSNNEDGSIPEGWSGTLISVSASMPYVWESQRTKDGNWSVWSTPILKNSWGKQGAKLRMRTWTENVVYLQGADGEEFYDVVVYNDKLYLCTKTHTSGHDNNPSASISGYLGYWESAQEWTFIATKLLLAEKINANQIDVDSLYVKHLDGADGTFSGELKAATGSFKGSVNIANGKIAFNEDGSGSIAKQDSLLKEGITFDSEGNVRLGANVEYLGFESHYYMGPIIKKQSDGSYLFYISRRGDRYSNYVTIPTQTNKDAFVMPAGEDWYGQFLYVYNFNYNNLALKTAPGELVIPAMSVGIFFASPATRTGGTLWTVIAINKEQILGVGEYEDIYPNG